MTNTSSVWDRWRAQNREQHRYRKTFDAIGLPEFWAEYWIPKEITPAEFADMEQKAAEKHRTWIQKCIEKALAKLSEAGIVAGTVTSSSSDVDLAVQSALESNPIPRALRMEEIAVLGVGALLLLRDWNLTSPLTNEKLPIPSIDDLDSAAEVFQVLPLPVLYEIKKGAEEAGEQIVPLEMRELTFGQRLKAIDSVLRAG